MKRILSDFSVEEDTMHSLWSLAAMAAAVPIYGVWQARRSARRKLRDNIPSVPQPSIQVTTVPESARQARVMQWVSIGEFLIVLEKCKDLIVIDLRANAQSDPFPIQTAFTLPVTPKELDTVLEWLPTDRSVVFYGASNLSIFMIETSHCMEGSAPLYVLEGDLKFAEAA
jgi:hypothetical protein